MGHNRPPVVAADNTPSISRLQDLHMAHGQHEKGCSSKSAGLFCLLVACNSSVNAYACLCSPAAKDHWDVRVYVGTSRVSPSKSETRSC